MAEIKLGESRVPERSVTETRVQTRPSEAKEAKAQFRLDPEILAAINGTADADPFWYDKSIQPIDMTYEWKRLTYGGKEDIQYQSKLKRLGWQPVPADRHLEIGTESTGTNTIVVGGQVLMERHAEYTKLAQQASKRLNDQQLGGMKERLSEVGNINMPRTVTNFKQTYESGQIID